MLCDAVIFASDRRLLTLNVITITVIAIISKIDKLDENGGCDPNDSD